MRLFSALNEDKVTSGGEDWSMEALDDAMKSYEDDHDVYLGGVWPTLLSSIWRRMILTMVKRDPCQTGILPTGSLPYRHIVSEASMGNQHLTIHLTLQLLQEDI